MYVHSRLIPTQPHAAINLLFQPGNSKTPIASASAAEPDFLSRRAGSDCVVRREADFLSLPWSLYCLYVLRTTHNECTCYNR